MDQENDQMFFAIMKLTTIYQHILAYRLLTTFYGILHPFNSTTVITTI